MRLFVRRVEALRERGALVALRGLRGLLAEAVEEVVLRRAFRAARAVVVLTPLLIAEDVVGLGQQTKTFLVAAAVGVLLEGLAAEGLAHLGGRGVAGHAEERVVVGGGHGSGPASDGVVSRGRRGAAANFRAARGGTGGCFLALVRTSVGAVRCREFDAAREVLCSPLLQWFAAACAARAAVFCAALQDHGARTRAHCIA